MHITMRPDSIPFAGQTIPSNPQHQHFLKQEIKKILGCRNYLQKHVPMGKPYHGCQKHTPKGSPQQFRLCVDYRKWNSLLPSVTPVTGTKKGTFVLMPLPIIDEFFTLFKEARYFIAIDLLSVYYYIKLDKESIPKCPFMTVFSKFEFLRLSFGLSQ